MAPRRATPRYVDLGSPHAPSRIPIIAHNSTFYALHLLYQLYASISTVAPEGRGGPGVYMELAGMSCICRRVNLASRYATKANVPIIV